MKTWMKFVSIMALIFGLLPWQPVIAQPNPTVYLAPADQTIDVGDTATVEVWVQDVSDFYGLELELEFDPTIVSGIVITAGAAFTTLPGEYEEIQNQFSTNAAEFAASLLRVAKALPLNGTLHLATISFQGIAPGVSPLTWLEIKLADSYGAPVACAALGGSITVQQAVVAEGNLGGRVFMEGRTDHSNTLVTLSPVMLTNLTDASGWYTFTAVPSDTYDLTMEHDLYLPALLTSCPVKGGESAFMPNITLLGGDLNGDDAIDIGDLTLGAGHFNQAFAAADINADGIVDIFDIVLIGKNFGLVGPILSVCP